MRLKDYSYNLYFNIMKWTIVDYKLKNLPKDISKSQIILERTWFNKTEYGLSKEDNKILLQLSFNQVPTKVLRLNKKEVEELIKNLAYLLGYNINIE